MSMTRLKALGRKGRGILGLGLVLLAMARLNAAAEPAPTVTQANVMTELIFKANNNYAHPFNDVALDALFIDPIGRELRVPAFWAGSNVWKVRYASRNLGTH